LKNIFKINHLRKIFIVSLIIAIALPAAVTLYIYPLFTAQLIANTEDEAIRAAKHFMLMTIPQQNELSTDFLTAESLKKIQKIAKDFNLIKLKIFSKSGETIYSTSSKDIGTINKNSYFQQIVAQGKTYTKVVKKKHQIS
jgi:ABC-type antimicrobial peptide transport system ATPase subunit